MQLIEGNIMNTSTVFDTARATRIAADYGMEPLTELVDDPEGAWTASRIPLEFADDIGRVDVTWADDGVWTVDPYLVDDPALTVEQARAMATSLLRAADMAEALNQPDPDMIVELDGYGDEQVFENRNLVMIDISLKHLNAEPWFSLRNDEWVGKHQPGDEWGRYGAHKHFIGRFDFIRWGEKDGRKVALLKHRA